MKNIDWFINLNLGIMNLKYTLKAMWIFFLFFIASVSAADFAEHIKFNPNGPNKIGYIAIDQRDAEISQATWLYVKKAMDFYIQEKPSFIILQLNTPGGEVFAAEKIADTLKELDTQYDIPIVAVIDNWAISAGAMLAYGSRYIAISKDAAMGAAEPLTIATEKVEVASEKVNSALRADFANRASFFGRDPNIAEAMVDKDIILVFREGKIVRLDSEDQIQKGKDTLISPKGKLLTLNADQLMKYHVADLLMLPKKLEAVTASEKKIGKWPASKHLLFTQPFFSSIPQATIEAYTMDWKTQFFVWLANPYVQSILFLGLMVGLYVEITTGGFGLAGTVALTSLFLILLSSFALQIANWLEIILLITGLLILFVEIFVLPSFGLLGFIGIIFFLMGLVGIMIPESGYIHYEFDTGTFNAAGEAFLKRLAWLFGTFVLGLGIIIFIARYITPSFSFFNRFVLKGNEQEGYRAVENAKDLPEPGSKGETLTHLRPAGKIIIRDTIYDAISAGTFIDKETPIIVERLDGSVIVVKAVES